MKMIRNILLITVLMFGFGAPVMAATESAGVIAVVDMQRVMSESKAGKSIQEKLDKKRKTYKDEISKQEEGLRSAEKELVKQRETLSKDDFAKKRKDFEKKVGEAQKLVQDHKRSLEKSFGSAMGTLRGEIAKVVSDIAEKRGVTLVLSRQNVVLAEKSLDITQEVLDNLNKTITDIPVEVKKK